MTTARTTSHHAAKKSAAKPTAKKSSAKSANHCWPGYEPVPGKAHNEKGSCKPKAGKQSNAVRRADQKAAAASKLQKTHPR
jgi:hypothetical protein